MASKTPLTSFTLFSKLPVELQLAIWELAIPDPTPEVCVIWPLYIDRHRGEDPIQPLVVDTAWPPIAHVCHASREVVLASGQLRLRYSPTAGFDVPFRAFDPAIDTLYWCHWQVDVMGRFLTRPENAPLARALRHIAIETSAAYPPSELAEIIRRAAIYLKTLSFVIPDSSDGHRACEAFYPPTRRFRLRDIPDDVVQHISLTRVPFIERTRSVTVSLLSWMDNVRRSMDRHVVDWSVQGDEGTAWSTENTSFSGVKFKAQTFVEYTMTADEGPQWRETCGGRELNGLHPSFEPVDRKNPEEYRVLDDRELHNAMEPIGWPDDFRL
ncbi:2EXR domain-containing protein [Madurella fahalii]|uniref:2EXR domain-containing protein n=1 Tax=Madurella fahalii TaxID=1157608 RepID=A0ABQ0FYP6_9PEZI